tara:strand:+ start:213 stop:659 length:447 start_codon:yes stop_codon:yes gene_type:complete
MYQYLLADIKNNINKAILDKLKNNFWCNEFEEHILLSDNGMYKIINDKIYKFSLVENNEIYKIPFKDSYLVKQNNPFKKNKYHDNWISPSHEYLKTKKYIFKYGEKGNTEFHLVFSNKKLIDLFILSRLEETQHSFQEDLELFYKLLQ